MKTSDKTEDLRLIISEYIEQAKLRNPRFSLRALASKLDISPGNLSQFLSGKRNFSPENIKKIVHLVTDNPEERKDLLERINKQEIEEKRKQLEEISTSDYTSKTLTEDEFASLDDWYHYAVRSVLSLKDARYDVGWIASKLGIPEAYAEKSINLLLQYGLIKINNGRIERTQKHIKTPDSTKKNEKIDAIKKKIHSQHLEHAQYSLLNHGPDIRDITWVNIPTNPRKLDQARELVRKFQDDLLALLEDEDASEVYRLTVQLCPMNRVK